MTQPNARQSLAPFRDRLLVKCLFVPASSQCLYVQRRDKFQNICAVLAAYLVQLPDGHNPNGGFGASAERFFSGLKRAGLRV